MGLQAQEGKGKGKGKGKAPMYCVAFVLHGVFREGKHPCYSDDAVGPQPCSEPALGLVEHLQRDGMSPSIALDPHQRPATADLLGRHSVGSGAGINRLTFVPALHSDAVAPAVGAAFLPLNSPGGRNTQVDAPGSSALQPRSAAWKKH